ncbi:MAG: hypothetical protein HC836_12505 [Richelia sp. RM2_1_2]|nr:hypothetical protein [Richelia sp. RM2_1_2]
MKDFKEFLSNLDYIFVLKDGQYIKHEILLAEIRKDKLGEYTVLTIKNKPLDKK